MKLSVLALDYDGTIARDGRADPAVLESIREARARQIVVLLVTGRILSDLRRVLADHGLFDAIVAENGAVLAFPNGRTRVLGRPPPPEFLNELRRLEVRFESGECVLQADASAAAKILDAVRNLELPLMLAFNRGRVMILPQGINKASGLPTALNSGPHRNRHLLCLGRVRSTNSALGLLSILGKRPFAPVAQAPRLERLDRPRQDSSDG